MKRKGLMFATGTVVYMAIGVIVVALLFMGTGKLWAMGKSLVGGVDTTIPTEDPSSVGGPSGEYAVGVDLFVKAFRFCSYKTGEPYFGEEGVFSEPCSCGKIRVPVGMTPRFTSLGELFVHAAEGDEVGTSEFHVLGDPLPLFTLRKDSQEMSHIVDEEEGTLESGGEYWLYRMRGGIGISSDSGIFSQACDSNSGSEDEVAHTLFSSFLDQHNRYVRMTRSADLCVLGHFDFAMEQAVYSADNLDVPLRRDSLSYSLELQNDDISFYRGSQLREGYTFPSLVSQRFDDVSTPFCFLDGFVTPKASPLTETMKFTTTGTRPYVSVDPNYEERKGYEIGSSVTLYNVYGNVCLDPVDESLVTDVGPCSFLGGSGIDELRDRLTLLTFTHEIVDDDESEILVTVEDDSYVELSEENGVLYLRHISGGIVLSEEAFSGVQIVGSKALYLTGSVTLDVRLSSRGQITIEQIVRDDIV